MRSIIPLLSQAIMSFTEVQLSVPDAFRNYQLRVVNALGELMLEKNNITLSSLTIDVGNFRSGIYFIEIIKEDKVIRKKIAKH